MTKKKISNSIKGINFTRHKIISYINNLFVILYYSKYFITTTDQDIRFVLNDQIHIKNYQSANFKIFIQFQNNFYDLYLNK